MNVVLRVELMLLDSMTITSLQEAYVLYLAFKEVALSPSPMSTTSSMIIMLGARSRTGMSVANMFPGKCYKVALADPKRHPILQITARFSKYPGGQGKYVQQLRKFRYKSELPANCPSLRHYCWI